MTKNIDSTLILFTGSYPYSSPAPEDSFIDPELPYLISSFSKVIIIPKTSAGEEENPRPDITVETTLAELLKLRPRFHFRIHTLLLVCTSQFFYKEILKKPNKTLHISSIWRIIQYLGTALRVKKWIIQYIEKKNLDVSKILFYTYWLDEITLGLFLATKKYPDIKIISRAHGIDLYEERSPKSYIPFRPEIFNKLNKVFIASKDGKSYLSEKYPNYISKFKVATLSIKKSYFITKNSDDDIFRIVSCSFLVPVKRIELLINGLKKLGELRPDNQFFWRHIGNGPEEEKLKNLSRTLLPHNIQYQFMGYLLNEDVLEFYKSNQIDVFINVSQSEGGNPVSIMESQSCGIPVIASAVGGNKEIVSSENGILLKKNPTATEIAIAIETFLVNKEILLNKKNKSYENWDYYYNSEKVCPLFVQELIHILTTSNESL
jgi:glycosyltransferase involved in cell wall biosynthesis